MTTSHDQVSLFEFMPYGAPELLAAQRPQLLRALVLASALALAAFMLAQALGLTFTGQRPVVIELPRPPVIIDTPPSSVVSEARILAAAADRVVLICKWNVGLLTAAFWIWVFVFQTNAVPDLNATFDGHAIADNHIIFYKNVVADVAVRSYACAWQNMCKCPDA
jgi:hypothetical protein